MAVIEYSDNSFSYFQKQRSEQDAARRALYGDPIERLANYIIDRRSDRVVRFSSLNGIKLDDPVMRAEVLDRVEVVRMTRKWQQDDSYWDEVDAVLIAQLERDDPY